MNEPGFAQQWQRSEFFNGLLERVCTSEDWRGQRISETARSVSGGGLGSYARIELDADCQETIGKAQGPDDLQRGTNRADYTPLYKN